MAEMDSYVKALGSIVSESEKEYLAPFSLGANDSIVKIIETVSKGITKIPKSTKVSKNEEVGRQIVLLSYLIYRLRFHGTKRLDFSNFPAMRELAEIVLRFTEKGGITGENLRSVNKIVTILSKVDERSTKARYGLGYRYVRLFMLLLLYGSYTNASIVANLILEQLEVMQNV